MSERSRLSARSAGGSGRAARRRHVAALTVRIAAALALGALLTLLGAVAGGGSPVAFAECARPFQRGDSNADSKVDISDPIATLGYLFLGSGAPACLDSADSDDSARVDLSDAVFTVSYLFLGGQALPPPLLGACGADPSPDDLGCAAYDPCAALEPQPCDSNDCCPLGSYCEKDVDDCDGDGLCVVRPEICPRLFDPWCGCDGVTYGNRCEAASAGVNVVHRGRCLDPGECLSSEDCDIEQYCKKEVGLCLDPGVCTRDPQLCAQVFDPVCGCDGVTYANSCIAAQAGVSVERIGACEPEGDCKVSDDCPLGSFCSKVEGFCDDPGFCREEPDPAACAEAPLEPVCGCDGVTYDSPCAAARAGASILRHGPCEEGTECQSSDDCTEDSYCFKKDGYCGEVGLCLQRPAAERCADLADDPVCGCDDATYRNDCEARLAGVSVAYRGPCDGIARCVSSKDCDEASYCATPEGLCGGIGLCAERPMDCPPDVFDPVCGCDGLTYANDCGAAQAGVAVQFRGTCDGGALDCQTNATCGISSYCSKPRGQCDGGGLCDLRPAGCPDVLDPVCGCDGITYDNECLAHEAGVNVLAAGACE